MMSSESRKEILQTISKMQSIIEFVDLVQIDYKSLVQTIYKTPKDKLYDEFVNPKKNGGERIIRAPSSELKEIQKKIYIFLQTIYIPKAATQGFTQNRSILSNAKRHKSSKKARIIYNVDIKDFFPSITFRRVKGLFFSPPYNFNETIATLLAQICVFKDELPQGAPTSPVISNMICARMDSQLTQLAKRFCCIYTRYADDITFSTTFPNFREGLIEGIHKEINSNGFEINIQKSRLLRYSRRQEITGLVVNQFPNVPRTYVRNIRAMIHEWDALGLEVACKNHNTKYQKIKDESRFKDFRRVLHGKIEFLRFVRGDNDHIYKRFYKKAKELEVKCIPEETKRIFTKEIIIDDDFDYSSYQYFSALAIGINDYQDESLDHLNYCVNDAKRVSSVLEKSRYQVTDLFTDNPADIHKLCTKSHVESKIKNLCENADDKDVILIYFACHGGRIYDNVFLYMFDTHVGLEATQGLSIKSIEDLLFSSQAKVKILIIDACRIGTGRSSSLNAKIELDSIIKDAEGYALLSASAANQTAKEDPEFEHGVFTYYLCKGLEEKSKIGQNQIITVTDIYEYIYNHLKRYCGTSQSFQKPAKKEEGYGKLPIIIR